MNKSILFSILMISFSVNLNGMGCFKFLSNFFVTYEQKRIEKIVLEMQLRKKLQKQFTQQEKNEKQKKEINNSANGVQDKINNQKTLYQTGYSNYILPESFDKDFMESIIESASKEVLDIINNAKSDFIDNCENIYFFVGRPGVSKSTSAQAIAYALHWPLLFINCSMIANEYKASGSQNILRAFDSAFQKNENCVIVMDELSKILENHLVEKDEAHDISTALWTILDECEKRHNILFIATGNDITRIPDPLKSRFLGSMIEIKKPSIEKLKNIFFKALTQNSRIHLSKTITHSFLLKYISDLNEQDIRIIKKLAKFIIGYAVAAKKEKVIITKKCFNAATKRLNENIKLCDLNAKQMTQVERLQKENFNFQAGLQEKNQTFQKQQQKEQQDFTEGTIDRNERFSLIQSYTQAKTNLGSECTQSLPFGSLIGAGIKSYTIETYKEMLSPEIRQNMMNLSKKTS